MTSSSSGAGQGNTQQANMLVISGFAFAPLTVKPGAKVTVNNEDSADHTVNVNGTNIDPTVPAGGQVTFTAPTKPGKYPLTCDIHTSMHGTLTVSG